MDPRSKLPNTAEREAEVNKSAKAKKKNIAIFLGFSIPESINFFIIFIMHLAKAFLDFLFNTPLRFIVFPAAALYGLTKAGLLWRQFHLIKKDYLNKRATLEERNIAFLQALWETLNGLGTTGAVVTGIVGFIIGASVGMGISITFNFFLATSTIICAAYTGYYGYTAHQAYKTWEKTGDKEIYKEYITRLEKAINHAIITGIVAMLTMGVIFAMVAGFPVTGAVIGMAGCLAAAVFSSYHLYKLLKNTPRPAEQSHPLPRSYSCTDLRSQKELTTNAYMHSSIGITRRMSFGGEKPEVVLSKMTQDKLCFKQAPLDKAENVIPLQKCRI